MLEWGEDGKDGERMWSRDGVDDIFINFVGKNEVPELTLIFLIFVQITYCKNYNIFDGCQIK